ncbi:MAG: S8 family peptidase [Phycisphaerae bacterium]|nr:S8 family peptidase [Phycisphaerae bacterium]
MAAARFAHSAIFGIFVAACAAVSTVAVAADESVIGESQTRRDLPTVTGPIPSDDRPVSGLVSQQYALEKLGVYDAWSVEVGDPSIVVAVIDSGVDSSHPDLSQRMWINPRELANGVDDDGNGYIDDIRGWDFVQDDNNPQDEADHGTHVAGIIAARGRFSDGVAGVANVTIMPLRVLDAQRQGVDSDVALAIDYAVKAGAHVINVSLGGPDSSAAMRNACAAAERAGVVVVAAVGNQGGQAVLYPAAYDSVLGIAAVDENDVPAAFSNASSAVDLAAPGVNILSTVLNQRYGFRNGTSMATAYVAGIAALLRTAHPDWTAAQIRAAIVDSADDINVSGWDEKTGFGRANAYRALTDAGADAPLSDRGVNTAPPLGSVAEPVTAGEQLAELTPCGFGVLPGFAVSLLLLGAGRRMA